MGRLVRSLLTVALIAANAVVWFTPAPAFAAVTTQVAAVTTPLPNGASGGTANNVTATCPGGTVMVGGGAYLRRIGDNVTVPGNGLKLNGTMPSDASSNPVADGATDPSSWTDVAGFGGQSDNGDEAIAFAMCSSGGPAHTTVKTATVIGVATENNPPVKATVTCPSGTRLVGGGALGTPPSEPSFKPIASYPSDSSGTAAANGATNPDSWTTYGSAGQPNTVQTTTAFAVCSTDPSLNVTVARSDTAGPQVGTTFTTTTIACPSGTQLLDGGVLIEKLTNQQPQQGVHIRGTFPSDASGVPVSNGAGNPNNWTNVVQSGGQATPGTNVQNYALCAQAPPPAQADLSITKTDSPDPVTTGGTLTYTLNVTNNGPDAATGVVATDTLPAGVTFQSASSGCTNASGTVTCTIGNLANGASASRTITVTAPSAAGSITNTATVAGNEGDPVNNNNSASATTTVNAPPAQTDLSITKTDSPDPVQTGGTLTYTLNVTNNGPSAATGVTATDTLPAAVSFQSASSGCTNASGTVTCTIGNLASGASVSRTITVTAPSAAGGITNTASVTATETDPNTGNNQATATTTVNSPPPAQADLSITKTDSPDPVTTGGTLTYTLTVKNNGPQAATGVVATDTLPAGVTFVSASSGCTNAAGTVTCTIGNLPASGSGATVTRTITATAPSTAGSISNTASVTGTENDPSTGNNSATATTTVSGQTGNGPDLSITKKGSPNPVDAGSTLTYKLTVENNGPGNASGVVVTDTLPAGVTYQSASSTKGSCTQSAGTVTCTIGTLNKGAKVTITIKVKPTDSGTITNTATVSGSLGDPKPSNNTASTTTTVRGRADVSIKKTAQPATVQVGQNVTYTLAVHNGGPSSATNVIVADTLPILNVSYVSATPSQGTCSVSGPIVTCNLGTIASGGNATVTIVVKATRVGTALNAAGVKANELDPSLANNLSLATVKVTR